MNRNAAAILKGTGVFVLISCILTISANYNTAFNIGYFSWFVFFVAGLVTSIAAASHKIFISLLIVLPAALIIYMANLAWQLSGKYSDFTGANAIQVIVIIVIPIGLILSGSGGVLGWFICKNKST